MGGQGLTLNELHGDHRSAFGIIDGENRADIDMIQGRGCARFAQRLLVSRAIATLEDL